MDVSPRKLNQHMDLHHKSRENSTFLTKSCAEQRGGSSACCGLINNAVFSVFPGEKVFKTLLKEIIF